VFGGELVQLSAKEYEPLVALAEDPSRLASGRVAFLAKSDNPDPPRSASKAKVALRDDGIGLTIGQEKPEAKGSL
jgi:hypothetical protein